MSSSMLFNVRSDENSFTFNQSMVVSFSLLNTENSTAWNQVVLRKKSTLVNGMLLRKLLDIIKMRENDVGD